MNEPTPKSVRDATRWQERCERSRREGTCYCCSEPAVRWMLCQKHIDSQKEAAARYRATHREERRAAQRAASRELTKLFREKNLMRNYRCGRCGDVGHNRRTCPVTAQQPATVEEPCAYVDA